MTSLIWGTSDAINHCKAFSFHLFIYDTLYLYLLNKWNKEHGILYTITSMMWSFWILFKIKSYIYSFIHKCIVTNIPQLGFHVWALEHYDMFNTCATVQLCIFTMQKLMPQHSDNLSSQTISRLFLRPLINLCFWFPPDLGSHHIWSSIYMFVRALSRSQLIRWCLKRAENFLEHNYYTGRIRVFS